MFKRLTFILLLISHLGLFAQTPELIFHSGFEPGVDTIDHDSSSIDIIGEDISVPTPNDWESDLETHPNIGRFKVQFKGGDETDRLAEIVADPEDPLNNVLQYWIINPNSGNNGRVQGNIYGNTELYNLFYSVRLYLPTDFNLLKNAPFDFRFVLMEFWNNANWTDEDNMFRIKVNLGKIVDEPDSLKIRISGQIRDVENDKWGRRIWDFTNPDYVIPVQKWMTIRIYFVEGDNCSGRFIFTVTPDGEAETIVHNIRNFTHHPDDPSPDGLSHFNPFKLYTDDELVEYVTGNGALLNLFWDDFELWKDSTLTIDDSCFLGGITFGSQEQIDTFAKEFPNCRNILGDIIILSDTTDITNLDSLRQITSIQGSLKIQSNGSLTSLSGLENLTCINGALHIDSNDLLSDLSALSNLRSLDGYLQISNNGSLPNLIGLENITVIAGKLEISKNNALTSLAGLDSIDYTTITELLIQNSDNLSFCELLNICKYIESGGTTTITGNAPGCSNQAEVESACLILLPVELSRFSGKEVASEVFLFWQTASETNNDYFQIEHSPDGRTFQPIGKVWGNGTTSEKQEYSFVHTQPVQGLNYYRLKQVDFDGKYEYSKIISIDIEFDDVFIQPNPTTGMVEIKGLNLEQANLKITDGLGRLIQTIQLSTYQTINLSNHPKGIYFFIIQTTRRTIVKRIIVE